MSKSYVLSQNQYLYAFIDNLNGIYLCNENIEAELAIDDNIITYYTGNPTILKSGDKLIVHGTEIQENKWKEICKSLYFRGLQCVYDSDHDCWRRGYKISRIGVNSEGDCISVFTDLRVYKNTTFQLPCKFDWSSYGVVVPNRNHDYLRCKVEEMEEQIKGREEEINYYHQLLNYYHNQLNERDEKLEKRKEKIKLFKKKLHLKEKEQVGIEELKKQVANLDQQLKNKDEWVRELVSQIVGSELVTKVAISASRTHESEKLNQKLDLIISLLHNI